MADSFIVVRYRENLTINSGTFVPDTGTEEIASCTATLFDAQRNVITGMNEVAVTGFIPGPQTAPYAYEGFSPVALSLPVPATQDCYTIDFEAIDTNGKHYVSTQCLIIKPRGV